MSKGRNGGQTPYEQLKNAVTPLTVSPGEIADKLVDHLISNKDKGVYVRMDECHEILMEETTLLDFGKKHQQKLVEEIEQVLTKIIEMGPDKVKQLSRQNTFERLDAELDAVGGHKLAKPDDVDKLMSELKTKPSQKQRPETTPSEFIGSMKYAKAVDDVEKKGLFKPKDTEVKKPRKPISGDRSESSDSVRLKDHSKSKQRPQLTKAPAERDILSGIIKKGPKDSKNLDPKVRE